MTVLKWALKSAISKVRVSWRLFAVEPEPIDPESIFMLFMICSHAIL